MIKKALKVRVRVRNWLCTDLQIGIMKLYMMQFSDEECQVWQQICDHLERYKVASKLMSGKQYPTLSFVMPIFGETFSHIEKQVIVAENEDPIKMAFTAAHGVL
jgi:hypothetical protein